MRKSNYVIGTCAAKYKKKFYKFTTFLWFSVILLVQVYFTIHCSDIAENNFTYICNNYKQVPENYKRFSLLGLFIGKVHITLKCIIGQNKFREVS